MKKKLIVILNLLVPLIWFFNINSYYNIANFTKTQSFNNNYLNQNKLKLNYVVPTAEGDYSRNSTLAEKNLTDRIVKASVNNFTNSNNLFNNFSQVRIKFDVRIGIYENSGNEYNYFNSYLWLIVDLKDALNKDINALSNSGAKKDREMLIPGWTNKEAGYYSKDCYYVTYVFEHTVGNYDKWVFLNTCVILDNHANFQIRYNGAYRFKNASSSKKYINIYIKAVDGILGN